MNAALPTLCLAASLDVEEEGLFGGNYAWHAPTVHNVAHLTRLLPLLERGLKPTLFCAHSIFTDAPSRRVLEQLRDQHEAEIGAHLHHWNTPPLSGEAASAEASTSIAAANVPLPLMAAKLATLFRAGADFQGAPLTSFRMGRWDLHRVHWHLLAQAGVLCDASVRPLHAAARSNAGATGPDHFSAPAHPYWVPVGDTRIFEVPLTVTPLLRPLPALCAGLPHPLAQKVRAGFKSWGALALLPVYHPLWAMQAITRLFVARGGRLLSLTWHSSEMMPGGAPHVPDTAAVDHLMRKIAAYLDWLQGRWPIRHLSMRETREHLGPDAPCPDFCPSGPSFGPSSDADPGDWTTVPEARTKNQPGCFAPAVQNKE